MKCCTKYLFSVMLYMFAVDSCSHSLTLYFQPRYHLLTAIFWLQNIIAEHEIRNISCAAQDPEDLCTFAYITKDLQTNHHYCHVFSTVDVVRNTPPLCSTGNTVSGWFTPRTLT